MKRIFTAILTFCIFAIGSSSIYAASVSKPGVLNTYSYASTDTKPTVPTSVLTKLYNKTGQLDVELSSSSKNVYTYNAQGLVSIKKSFSWSSTNKLWNLSSKTTYEYDGTGQLIRENSYSATADTLTSYRVLSGYENGVYNSAKTMNYNGSKFTYWNTYKLAFDNGLLTSSVRYNQTSETNRTPLDSTVYTYANGKKATAVLYIYNGSKFVGNTTGTSSETFSYNTNGDLTTDILTSISRYGNYISYNEYVYTNYDESYAPTNLTASPKTGAGVAPNLVTLSWTAAPSSAVTGYRVVCDTIVSGIITGNTYTTSTQGQNGVHEYSVIAVAGSEMKNTSNRVSLTLNDTGVIPANNVKVTTISDKKESDGSYDVTVVWDAPQTTSTITGYRVYYSSYSYIDTKTTTAVVNISAYNAEGTDANGDTYGKDVKIYVLAMYTTGTASQSNIVTCNPYKKTISAVENTNIHQTTVYHNQANQTLIFSEPVTASVYNTNGVEVKKLINGSDLSVSGLSAGVYVVKMINQTGIISNAKCVIR